MQDIVFGEAARNVSSLNPLSDSLFRANNVLNGGRFFLLEVDVEPIVENVRALLRRRIEPLHVSIDIDVS